MKRFLFSRSGSERAVFVRPSLFWAIAGTGSALVATALASLISVPNTAEAVLSRFDRCNEVATLQTKLSEKGYSVGPLDGIFGAQTESAVRQFQQDRGDLIVTGQGAEATLSALDLSRSLECRNVSEATATYLVNTPFGGSLNLRRDPNGEVLTSLRNQTAVAVVENRGDWSRLQRGGWVYSKYLLWQAGRGDGGGEPTPAVPYTTVMSVPGSLDVSQNTAPSPATFGVARCPHVATVRSSGSLYVYDNPNGSPLGTAREGRELCLSGRGTISNKEMWTELISGNWVDSGNIKITK